MKKELTGESNDVQVDYLEGMQIERRGKSLVPYDKNGFEEKEGRKFKANTITQKPE